MSKNLTFWRGGYNRQCQNRFCNIELKGGKDGKDKFEKEIAFDNM